MTYSNKIIGTEKLPIYFNIGDGEMKLNIITAGKVFDDEIAQILQPLDQFSMGLALKIIDYKNKRNTHLITFNETVDRIAYEMVDDFNELKEHQLKLYLGQSNEFFKKYGQFSTNDGYMYGFSSKVALHILYRQISKLVYLLKKSMDLVEMYMVAEQKPLEEIKGLKSVPMDVVEELNEEEMPEAKSIESLTKAEEKVGLPPDETKSNLGMFADVARPPEIQPALDPEEVTDIVIDLENSSLTEDEKITSFRDKTGMTDVWYQAKRKQLFDDEK